MYGLRLFLAFSVLGLVAPRPAAEPQDPKLREPQGIAADLIFQENFESGQCSSWSAIAGAGSGCDATGCRLTISPPGGRFTVVTGPHTDAGSCGGSGSEAYATFELDEVSDVFVATHNSLGLDTVVYLREGTCDGVQVACNDDADGLQTSALALELQPGTYQLFVDTEAAVSVEVDVDVYINTASVQGDRCGQPFPLPQGPSLVTGSTCGFANDYVPLSGPQCGGGVAGFASDRVLYFVLPEQDTVTVNGCSSSTSTRYDQLLHVRGVCTDVGSQVACNDDGCTGLATCTGGGRNSSFSQLLAPGLYYVIIDGYGSVGDICSCGAFEFSFSGF